LTVLFYQPYESLLDTVSVKNNKYKNNWVTLIIDDNSTYDRLSSSSLNLDNQLSSYEV